MRNSFLTLLATLLIMTNCLGQLKVAKIFSDNMMLQADAEVPIWGQATPKSTVEINLNGIIAKEKVDSNGNWRSTLSAQVAGTTATIHIKNENKSLHITNIIYGDVWLCGGQSNMEWFVEGADNAEEEIKNANFSDIRIFDVPRRLEALPATDLPSGEWEVCSSASIPQFSAIGYFFGKYLHQELDRPIGLIGDNFGGTVVEAWTSAEALKDVPYFQEDIAKLKTTDIEEVKRDGDSSFNNWLEKFKIEDNGMQDTSYLWADTNTSDWSEMSLPTLWESSPDSTLHEKDGVIWFSREFNLEKTSNATLSLGPIDDSDITWINGQKVGETYNQFNKDRTYQVNKDVLKKGKNKITIRVEDYVGGGGIYGKEKKIFLQTDTETIGLSGKWKYNKGMIVSTPMPSNSFSPNNFPTCLYNGMIAPITDFPIKGVIWYQGESNSYRAYEYRTLFPLLINDWRKQWKQDELPFLFVQLANFKEEQAIPKKSEWAELREAQAMALSLDHTAMISAIDLGEANNIHPTNKQEVGKRLAHAALTEVYNTPKAYKGPTYKNHEVDESSIIITFDIVGNGLEVKNKHGYVYGFTIAGEDKKYEWAKAEIISKDKVRVWSNKISKPISVRYAWQDNPNPANLTDDSVLPALPFRTDNYTISTFDINRL